ncbi:MAG TPA: carboxypeptidase-like regulatory domain-containing protein [Terriglobales bacterium]|nr:carboxypeptidase-like regulatory domain-containing protein [Terriglobales bacterium]
MPSAVFAVLAFIFCSTMLGQSLPTTGLKPGTIAGTVTDVNQDTVPAATVVLDSRGNSDHRSVVTNENGYFEFHDVKPGISYQVHISAPGFADWQSPAVILDSGQFKIVADIQLRIQTELTTVQVTYDPVEVATEQVKVQEQQRVLGFIPNFYVVYDQDPAPLTSKLKFQLALKVSRDPVTIAGVAFLAGMEQAGDRLDYGQGMKGYGKRFGAAGLGNFTNIMVGGAILPSLLHQDPRYFFKGTGTTGSRIRYAMMHPFVCKGDNGSWQPNYSSMGGDLTSAALSNAYYPKADRGAGLVLSSFVIDTGARVAASLAQEFLLKKFTHKPDDTK